MSCNSLNASINDVTSEVHVPRRGFMRAALLLGAAALLPAAYVGKSLGSTNLPKVRAMRLPPVSTTADAADQAAWLIYRTRFIAPEGRVVDTGNGGVSHSEGQGYAMLFATWTNDRPSFERLWNWTHAHLSRPSDALHAWRWDPRRAVHVEDLNSATDGDLMIAWALLRGAERWDVPQWRERGLAIGRDILAASTREVGERTYLLPAPYGFDHDDRLVLNPSHYVFPAMRALAAARPDPRWAQLERDGLWLMESARFGEFRRITCRWIGSRVRSASPAAGRKCSRGTPCACRCIWPGRVKPTRRLCRRQCGSGRLSRVTTSRPGPICVRLAVRPIQPMAASSPWQRWGLPPRVCCRLARPCRIWKRRAITTPAR